MYRNFTGEWERKKWYLIRSLFDDAQLLSPIPETQEPPPDPSSPIEIALSRPYSPLPDLVIVKEPNKHDEPEEYYEEIEKKIMKYYRKLFFDEQSSESSDIEDSEISILNRKSHTGRVTSETFMSNDENSINNDALSDENSYVFDIVRKPDKLHSNESRSPSQKQVEADEEESVNNTSLSNDSNTDNSRSPNSDPCDSHFIITQPQVHRAGSEDIDVSARDVTVPSVLRPELDEEQGLQEFEHNEIDIESCSKQILRRSASDASAIDSENLDKQSEIDPTIEEFEDDEVEGATSSSEEESILKSQSSGLTSDARSSPDEPETMRRRRTRHDSFESIHDINVAKYRSEDYCTEIIPEIGSCREMEQSDISSSELNSSFGTTPKKSSIRKRKTDKECNWQEIKKTFFKGRPRIFNLYSCRNHV